ncbi:hypothetical protein CEXT_509161 [Caerostris extrusa]|uniref:Uncharacterized protein n=1 Tax=Caerostris extrusa TaxID=172846 RepID=A0AAV4Q385_CAEEX|nr:hypothetical protein CEXT_509161 [Caerostris extrusa]
MFFRNLQFNHKLQTRVRSHESECIRNFQKRISVTLRPCSALSNEFLMEVFETTSSRVFLRPCRDDGFRYAVQKIPPMDMSSQASENVALTVEANDMRLPKTLQMMDFGMLNKKIPPMDICSQASENLALTVEVNGIRADK